MNQQAKRAIRALILELCHTLEDDIAVQLKRFGYAGRRWIEPEGLPHIWNDEVATAQRQRKEVALAQELRRMGVTDPAKATAGQCKEAVIWFVREIAYTLCRRKMYTRLRAGNDLLAVPKHLLPRALSLILASSSRGTDDLEITSLLLNSVASWGLLLIVSWYARTDYRDHCERFLPLMERKIQDPARHLGPPGCSTVENRS